MNNNSTNVNNLVVGLDIGTTKIATVVGYRNENGQIEVIGHGLGDSTGVEFGEIKNLNHTVEGILHSKDIASQRTNFEIEEAYVGIAGHHIKTSKYNRYIHRDGNRNPISQEEIDNAKKTCSKSKWHLVRRSSTSSPSATSSMTSARLPNPSANSATR